MNSWQCLKQLRYLIRARTWKGTGDPIFQSGSVIISSGPNDQGFQNLSSPICIIRPLSAQSDPEHDEEPDLIMQSVGVRILTKNANDAFGQAPIMGGARTGGQTSSAGRGILEIEEELFNAVKVMSEGLGVRVFARARGAAEAAQDDALGYLAWRDYNFDILTTATLFFHAPIYLTATPGASHAVTLAWALPPTRFDTLGLVLRRAVGSTAPAGPTDGTGVTVTASATSVSDNTGATGVHSYSLFRSYDDIRDTPTTVERYSAAATVSVTAT
jgi:hypothetical protein